MQNSSLSPFLTSNNLLGDGNALRQRMADEGYLFFHGIGPKQKILEARTAMIALCHSAGWCDAEARWSGAGPFTEGDLQYMEIYKQVIKLPSFLSVAEDSATMHLVGQIVHGTPLLHRLRIGRITFPNNVQQTTAAHQDHWYIRGSEQTYTIWTPLGDCPIMLGGLAILPGSHRHGFIEHRFHPEKKYAGHGLGQDQMPPDETRWVGGDFALGDLVMFHSLTIHKALPNLTRDRLRLSTDNRYQRQGDAIAEISTKAHYNL